MYGNLEIARQVLIEKGGKCKQKTALKQLMSSDVAFTHDHVEIIKILKEFPAELDGSKQSFCDFYFDRVLDCQELSEGLQDEILQVTCYE